MKNINNGENRANPNPNPNPILVVVKLNSDDAKEISFSYHIVV